jgi:RimJ/RimL family protein N-acetyltransferase
VGSVVYGRIGRDLTITGLPATIRLGCTAPVLGSAIEGWCRGRLAPHGWVGISARSEQGAYSRMMIDTPRTSLRCWQDSDRDAFAALHAHPEVMFDAGGALDRSQSDAKLDRYAAAFAQFGFTRWAIESRAGELLGYAGIMPSRPAHPLGPHVDIGWRLARSAWGRGYATEAAAAALHDAFTRCGLAEVLAYTTADNTRSRAVMERLRLRRDPERDYSEPLGDAMWHGLVWVATPPPR